MSEPTEMEPTELAPIETETDSIRAWALADQDDQVDYSEPPTERLTSRRITALGVAASLLVIALAGVVAFVVHRQHNKPDSPSAPVVETVAAPPAAVTTNSVAIPSGPTIGDACTDRMKFATDPVSGQEMICDNYSENITRDGLKWFSAEKGAVGPDDGAAVLPRVGRVGSSCAGEVLTTQARSSDGYRVWCNGGPGSYMPGTTTRTWMVFHP